MEFEIDVEAYFEAEGWALDFLKESGPIGAAVVRGFRRSDHGASQIVDALAVNMLDPDDIKVHQNPNMKGDNKMRQMSQLPIVARVLATREVD